MYPVRDSAVEPTVVNLAVPSSAIFQQPCSQSQNNPFHPFNLSLHNSCSLDSLLDSPHAVGQYYRPHDLSSDPCEYISFPFDPSTSSHPLIPPCIAATRPRYGLAEQVSLSQLQSSPDNCVLSCTPLQENPPHLSEPQSLLHSQICGSAVTVDNPQRNPSVTSDGEEAPDSKQLGSVDHTLPSMSSSDSHFEGDKDWAVLRLLRELESDIVFDGSANARSSSVISAFKSWTPIGVHHRYRKRTTSSQFALKRCLLHMVYKMKPLTQTQSCNKSKNTTDRHKAIARQHLIAERRRRDKQNECYNVLRGLFPFNKKKDKAALLKSTINYLRKLESRVQELESFQNSACSGNLSTEPDSQSRNDSLDFKSASPETNRSRSCWLDSPGLEVRYDSLCRRGVFHLQIYTTIHGQQECPLLQILRTLREMGLESYSVQSKLERTKLYAHISAEAKQGEANVVISAEQVRQALARFVSQA